MTLTDKQSGLIKAIVILQTASDQCFDTHSTWLYFCEALLGYKCPFVITYNATVYLLEQAEKLMETEATQ